jgi:hypothetical protein
MSTQTITSDLLVELSTEEQQLQSGGYYIFGRGFGRGFVRSGSFFRGFGRGFGRGFSPFF